MASQSENREAHARFAGCGFFRLEGIAGRIGAEVLAESLAVHRIERDFPGGIEDQPHLRTDLAIGFAGARPSGAIVAVGFEVVVARPGSGLQLFGDLNLILDVDAPRFRFIDPIRLGCRGRQGKLAVDRIVDVDLVPGLGGLRRHYGWAIAQEDLGIDEPIIISADQRPMPHRAGVESPAQFAPHHRVVGIVIAITALTRQSLAVDVQQLPARGQLGFGGIAFEVGLAVAPTEQEAPVGTEIVLELHLVADCSRFHRTISGFAQEAFDGDNPELVVDGHDATIEGYLLAREFQFIGQRRLRGDLPESGWGQAITRGFEGVAKAACILVEAIDAYGDCIVERPRPVAIGAVGLEASAGGAHFTLLLELRLLGDQVDRAAGFATSIEGRVGSLEDFDALDARKIARSAEAASGIEPVHEIAAGQVLIAGESAHRIVVPQPAEIILARSRGREIQGLGKPTCSCIVQGVSFDDRHSLGRFAQGEIASVSSTLASNHQCFSRCRHGRWLRHARWFRFCRRLRLLPGIRGRCGIDGECQGGSGRDQAQGGDVHGGFIGIDFSLSIRIKWPPALHSPVAWTSGVSESSDFDLLSQARRGRRSQGLGGCACSVPVATALTGLLSQHGHSCWGRAPLGRMRFARRLRRPTASWPRGLRMDDGPTPDFICEPRCGSPSRKSQPQTRDWARSARPYAFSLRICQLAARPPMKPPRCICQEIFSSAAIGNMPTSAPP